MKKSNTQLHMLDDVLKTRIIRHLAVITEAKDRISWK